MRRYFGGQSVEDYIEQKRLKRLSAFNCEQCGYAPAKKVVKGTMLCGKNHNPKRRKYA